MTLRTLWTLSLLASLTACFEGDKDDDNGDDDASATDGSDGSDGADGSDGSGGTEEDACGTAANGWPDRSLPADYEAGQPSGAAYEGEHFYVFSEATDQHGSSDVALGQFYGSTVLVAIGAEWCPPCQEAAETSQALMDNINERDPDIGFVTVELLLEDRNGDPGTAAVAERWANAYGIDYPVLVGDELGPIFGGLDTNSVPTLVVLDPTLEVRAVLTGFSGDGSIRSSVERSFADFRDDHPDWEPTCPDTW